VAITDPGRIESDLSNELRRAVLEAMRQQGLNADAVAERLDLIPTAVRALLVREHWSLKTALVMAEGLDLPIDVDLRRREIA